MQTNRDKDILARTLYGEARGSSDLDKYAVACVIRNRAKIAADYHKAHFQPHPLFGSGKISEVCLKPYQFSCWNKNDVNHDILVNLNLKKALKDDRAFKICFEIAEQVVDGFCSLEDITHGSTHFHTKKMGWPKAWGKEQPYAVKIGAHLFYNNIQ